MTPSLPIVMVMLVAVSTRLRTLETLLRDAEEETLTPAEKLARMAAASADVAYGQQSNVSTTGSTFATDRDLYRNSMTRVISLRDQVTVARAELDALEDLREKLFEGKSGE